jgi:mannose-1-phosphate guanylyltransferase
MAFFGTTGWRPFAIKIGRIAIRRAAKAPLKAVILVGGEGTRLRPLTYDTPKPMIPVLNRPFLEHTIAYLKSYQVEEIVLAVSYLPEVIQEYFSSGTSCGVRLTYAVESSPLGTAGAVKNAERHLDSTFIVLNGDIFTGLNLADMLALHRQKRAKTTISLTWVDNPSAFGVVETDSEGRVQCFVEKPPPDQVTSHWINAGIYILEPEVLKHVPADSFYMFEQGLFPRLIELGEPVYSYPFEDYWLDMGTADKYLQLSGDLLRSVARSALIGDFRRDEVCCDRGVAIHPLAEIVGPVVIGSGCQIGQGARIIGPVVLGPDCRVAGATSIERAVLWQGVEVDAGAVLAGCVVGNGARIDSKNQAVSGFCLDVSEG